MQKERDIYINTQIDRQLKTKERNQMEAGNAEETFSPFVGKVVGGVGR